MTALVLAVFCCLASLVASAPRNGPVPRGRPYLALESRSGQASPHQFPWLASIQVQMESGKWEHNCGGSLIAVRDGQTESDILVSAAHCFSECYESCRKKGPENEKKCDQRMKQKGLSVGRQRIVLGEHALNDEDPEEKKFSLAALECHDFMEYAGMNDIALVKLSSPVKFSKNIRPVRLQATLGEGADSNGDTGCQIAGWGLMGPKEMPNIARYANVSIYGEQNCSKWLHGNLYDPNLMICAGRDTQLLDGIMRQVVCEGDSGGPLTCSNRIGASMLVGVVSRGGNPLCVSSGSSLPDVYTKVAPYVDWIVEKANELTDIEFNIINMK